MEHKPLKGVFILVVGPSGSGKGTLLDSLRAAHPDFVFPVSCTTRGPRPGEKEGETYYYTTQEVFKERIEKGDFLEWAEYGGNYYGTLLSEILEPLKEGRTVVREVEVQGARAIKERIPPEHLRIIFVYGGSWEMLAPRIKNRSEMSQEELEGRKERYRDEVTFKAEADFIIENFDGKQKEAMENLERIIKTIHGEI